MHERRLVSDVSVCVGVVCCLLGGVLLSKTVLRSVEMGTPLPACVALTVATGP